jgi:hypothetical protein
MSIVLGTTAEGTTARDVVTGAMWDLGIISLGEQADGEELAYGLTQLDLMLKALAAEGLNPWTEEEGEVSFAAGEYEATMTPRPAEVSEARLVMSGTYQRSLYRWGSGEYNSIPSKTQRGTPIRYDLRQTATEARLRVWPVPNVPTTVAFTYTRAIENVDAGTVLDVPEMWNDAIRKMLKARLTAFMPEGLPQYVYVEAEVAKQRLLDYGRPESYVLGPMAGGWYA